jgi:hypothetical protein
MNNESILLGIWPVIRNVDQEVIFSYIFLSDNARPCIHTPYAFCYRSRPSCDFFLVLCIGYRRSTSEHGGAPSERKNLPYSRGCSSICIQTAQNLSRLLTA